MQIVIEREVFVSCLERVQSTIDRKSISPVASSVHLRAEEGGKLIVSATNFIASMREELKAEVLHAGEVLTPAVPLYDVVRKLDRTQQHITLMVHVPRAEQQDEKETETESESTDLKSGVMLKLLSGRTRLSLITRSTKDFSSVDIASVDSSKTSEDSTSQSDSAALLIRQVRFLFVNTLFSSSSDDTREYLCGVFLTSFDQHPQLGNTLRAVATDGHRMAVADVRLEDSDRWDSGLIIPRVAVRQMIRVFGSLSEASPLLMGSMNQSLRLDTGAFLYQCRTLGDNFPDYRRVIPTDNPYRLVVERKQLTAVIDRVATMADRASRLIRFSLSSANLLVQTRTEHNEEIKDEISVDYDSPPIDIGFNADYLLETLDHIEHDHVGFFLKDTTSPVLVAGVSGVTDGVTSEYAGMSLAEGARGSRDRKKDEGAEQTEQPEPLSAVQYVIMPMRYS